MKAGLWRHKEMRDVAFEIHKSFWVKEKQVWKLKVGWWNIGSCHDPWPMAIEQRIEIREEDVGNYQKIGPGFRVPKEEFAPRRF